MANRYAVKVNLFGVAKHMTPVAYTGCNVEPMELTSVGKDPIRKTKKALYYNSFLEREWARM